MLILLAYILANHSFVQANGAHAVPSRPKVIPCQILCPSEIPPVDKNRGLSFELSHRVCNAELGRYAQTHVHMVSKSMPLDQFQPKLWHNSRKIPPISFRSLPKIAFFRYFGMNTKWYRQYQRTCAWLSQSRIGSPHPCPGGLGLESLLFPTESTPERSNLLASHRQRRWFNCWNYCQINTCADK